MKAARSRSVDALTQPLPAVTVIYATWFMWTHVELGREWPCYCQWLEMIELGISKLKDGSSIFFLFYDVYVALLRSF